MSSSSPPSIPTIFSLENQSLKLSTVEEAYPHLEPLRASTSITEIRLGGNTLGVPACTEIASLLSKQQNLQVANLADIFTSRLLSEIPQALSALLTSLLQLPNLHTVDLSDNAFGLNTVGPLVAFLKEHVPLKHLILNNNGLGPYAGIQIADALSELAEKKALARKEGKEVPDLCTIICGRNRLESGSMTAWARALKNHRGVRKIKMTQNGIRQDGIAVLLREGLRGCEELEVLDLQDNTFTITGSLALSEVVGGWKQLRELGVGDCLLGARGGMAVAEALSKGTNRNLRVLRAQYNDLDAKGVKALLVASEGGLPELRRVELNGNKFSEDDEGVEGLRVLLNERKEEAGERHADAEWGLDDLSDLEEDSDDDDEGETKSEAEDDASDEEIDLKPDVKAERILKEADEAEDETVPQEEDRDVDALAEQLDKKL
ncbi:MAG: hypothetical protein Q9187_004283 [Circinaria calcarea]